MIRKMKKITLLALESEKAAMMDHLAELSVMHVTLNRGRIGQGKAAEILQKLSAIARAKVLLEDRKKQKGPQFVQSAEDCLDRIAEILAEKEENQKQLEQLHHEEELLMPWGDFDRTECSHLADKGIFMRFWQVPAKKKPVPPEGLILQEVSKDSRFRYLVSVSTTDAILPDAVEVKLPERRLSDVKSGIVEAVRKQKDAEIKLASLVCNLPALTKYAEELRNTLDFTNTELSTETEGQLVLLKGYVPEFRMTEFQEAARKYGWAYLAEDPALTDDQVPTLITKPRWLSVMDPLFDLIGVDPGYRENDVNAFFFIFFPIFFGMIFGDAGYGCLIFLTCLTLKIILRKQERMRLPMNLMMLLSSCAICWGWLNGSWFGIPAHCLPSFMRGWSFLTNPEHSPLALELVKKTGLLTDQMTDIQKEAMWAGLNDKLIQWFCFFLAAIHLCSARLFRFIADIRHDWRAVGNLGWGCLVAANFFMAVNLIVFPGTFPEKTGEVLYGLGVVLVLITTQPIDLLNLPFNLIGSFTDVLSYIRLFAVGLAGTYIAVSFNNMGVMITEGKSGFSYILAVIAMILIMLFGHILNIALNFLSVMVHAIRLNTLEFSGHIGMQWAGIRYKPLTKHNKQDHKTTQESEK